MGKHKTQIELARKGILSERMKKLIEKENIKEEVLLERIATGKIILPGNILRAYKTEAIGIGKGLRTKINANIGTSKAKVDLELEKKKMKIAIEAGADSVMDLSTGGELSFIRKALIKECNVLFGTVPIYEAAVRNARNKKEVWKMREEDIFKVIEEHIEDGVDFLTLHCGVTYSILEFLEERTCGVVSRGGSFLVKWMQKNNKENPLYKQFDRIIELCKKRDVTISLGDGLRPGCLADSMDKAQVQELITLGKLAKIAIEEGVQVMIEGPGHVPINQIKSQVELQKALCNDIPFYVLGPIVTDIAPGYDHITGAIGGAIAGMYGADFLCYVTPAEHLSLPLPEDVYEGVMASKIAAHVADLAKGIPGAYEKDLKMAKARKQRDWETQIRLSIDPEKSRRYKERFSSQDKSVCAMCGEYCVFND